jgi:hypothetical protein
MHFATIGALPTGLEIEQCVNSGKKFLPPNTEIPKEVIRQTRAIMINDVLVMDEFSMREFVTPKINTQLRKMYSTSEFEKCHLQSKKTPLLLVHEILQKLSINGSVLCMFNVEWVIYLTRVLKKDVNTIFFVDDGIDNNDGTGKIKSFKSWLVVNVLGVPKHHIIHFSKLGDLKMKFDCVLGNPPFQDSKDDGTRCDQGSNLWVPFWKTALMHTSSKCALITPTTWLSPSKDFKNKSEWGPLGDARLWNIFNKYSSIAEISPRIRETFFPTIGSTFGYVIVDVNGNDGLKFTDGHDFSAYGFRPDPKKTDEAGIVSIKKNISAVRSETLEHFFKIDQTCSTDLKVAVPMSRTKGFAEQVQILEGEKVPLNSDGKPITDNYDPKNNQVRMFIYIHVPDMDTAVHVRNRILECEKILNSYCRWAGFMNIQICKMVKLNP